MSLGRSLVAGVTAGWVLSCPAWAAPPPVLVQNQGLLGASFAVLTLAVVVLGALEYKESKGRSLDLEIDRLAAAAAQRQAKLSNDASTLLEEEQASAPSAAAAPPPPAPGPPPPPAAPLPPPPTARMPVPPMANKIPSPPPPPPPPDSGDTFSSRLADTEIVKPPPRPPTPIAFGAPSAPPVTESVGNTSGGWADLLQRVRSNEGEGPNPFKSGTTPSPASNEPPKAGGDAWEALLRKTAGGPSGEGASPFGKSAESASPFAAKPGVPGPNPEAGGSSGEAGDSAVPDFVKKTSRMISLDLNKGGSSSNPFQSP